MSSGPKVRKKLQPKVLWKTKGGSVSVVKMPKRSLGYPSGYAVNVGKVNTKNIKSVTSKLKNVWTQYKSGDIPTTVPWFWKKTGVKKLGNQLKAINKKT